MSYEDIVLCMCVHKETEGGTDEPDEGLQLWSQSALDDE